MSGGWGSGAGAIAGPPGPTGPAGGGFVAVTTAADYTAATGQFVIVDASGGPVTVTLPAITEDGLTVKVAKGDNSVNEVTVAVDAAPETIVGAATYKLAVQYHSVLVVSDASNWFI